MISSLIITYYIIINKKRSHFIRFVAVSETISSVLVLLPPLVLSLSFSRVLDGDVSFFFFFIPKQRKRKPLYTFTWPPFLSSLQFLPLPLFLLFTPYITSKELFKATKPPQPPFSAVSEARGA